MKISDFELTNISLSASSDPDTLHDFTSVHHGFLSLRGVIPDNWTVNATNFTQSSFSVRYENGIHLLGEPRLFQVSQVDNLNIGEEYIALKLMTNYLTSVSPDIFQLLGIQMDFQILQEDSNKWVLERFVCSKSIPSGWDDAQPVLILSTHIEGMLVNFACMAGMQPSDEPKDDLFRVTIHAGCGPFSSSGELVRWCYKWAEYENTLLQNLASLTGAENDLAKN